MTCRRRFPENVRAVLEALRDAGFAPVVLDARRRGFRIQWRDRGGRHHQLAISESSADRHATTQALQDVRRAWRRMAPTYFEGGLR
jgi:hypothetical protein